MKIEDFPENGEIKEIETAIEDLKKTHSWEAVMLAKTDLQDLLKKREEWLQQNIS